MFKVGISGDLLNSSNEPCFGIAPLNLLKDRDDIEIGFNAKFLIEMFVILVHFRLFSLKNVISESNEK